MFPEPSEEVVVPPAATGAGVFAVLAAEGMGEPVGAGTGAAVGGEAAAGAGVAAARGAPASAVTGDGVGWAVLLLFLLFSGSVTSNAAVHVSAAAAVSASASDEVAAATLLTCSLNFPAAAVAGTRTS